MKNDDDDLNVYDVEQKKFRRGEEKRENIVKECNQYIIPPQGVRYVIAKKKYEAKGR